MSNILEDIAERQRRQIQARQDRVELGDVVRFRFAMNPPIQGELVSIPSGPGDCWIVRQDTGTPVYVQQFDYMHPVRNDSDQPF